MTDAQWGLLEPLLPPVSLRGHPRTVHLREVVNGILYVLRGGISWRMMPHDLPPWGTVWWYFRKWRQDGIWERVLEALRPGGTASHGAGERGTGCHSQRGNHRQPIGKDHGKRGPRGYDAGKKVSGRKRHIVVDTTGLLLAVVIHAANIQALRRAQEGRGQAGAGQAAGPVPQASGNLGRCGLCRSAGGVGLGDGRMVAEGGAPETGQPSVRGAASQMGG